MCNDHMSSCGFHLHELMSAECSSERRLMVYIASGLLGGTRHRVGGERCKRVRGGAGPSRNCIWRTSSGRPVPEHWAGRPDLRCGQHVFTTLRWSCTFPLKLTRSKRTCVCVCVFQVLSRTSMERIWVWPPWLCTTIRLVRGFEFTDCVLEVRSKYYTEPHYVRVILTQFFFLKKLVIVIA